MTRPESDPLLLLIPDEESGTESLARFIEAVLVQGRAWDPKRRSSDGISFCRIVEREPHRIRLAGRIYDISQELFQFWLDVERSHERSEEIDWTLRFDVIPGPESPKRATLATEFIDTPKDAEWRIYLTGTAVVRDGALAASVR